MSTITKQWLQQKIAGMEAARDEIPFGLGEDDSNTLAALRIALTSLEAEPVAWRSLYYENHGLLTGSKNVLASWQKQGWKCEPLYAVPQSLSNAERAERAELQEYRKATSTNYQNAIDILRTGAANELDNGCRAHHNALIFAANVLENAQAFGGGA